MPLNWLQYCQMRRILRFTDDEWIRCATPDFVSRIRSKMT